MIGIVSLSASVGVRMRFVDTDLVVPRAGVLVPRFMALDLTYARVHA